MRARLSLWQVHCARCMHLQRGLLGKNPERLRTNLQRSLRYGHLRGSRKLQLLHGLRIDRELKVHLRTGLREGLPQWAMHCAGRMHVQ